MNFVARFLKLEAAGGIILFGMAVIALILCNSPLAEMYEKFWLMPISIRINHYSLSHSLLFWVNEGLMTLFFLMVGLELKREFLEGELAGVSKIILPAIAALGGMVVPALIYVLVNRQNPDALLGWAIPVATDIAFALGVLSLFGKKVPVALKLFLLSLAIFDDVGAILIIAVFHTRSLFYFPMLIAFFCIFILWLFNRNGVQRLSLYIVMGLILWLCVLKSGVHGTVAGVVLAFFIPLRTKNNNSSPSRRLENTLTPWVTYLVMPIFALANAGVSLQGLSRGILLDSIVVGIVLGLFLGKQIGVCGFVWIITKLGWAKIPENTSWMELYGVAILCGIGFTMSLFLGTLAFEGNPVYLIEVRLGVLIGSLLSGIVGALLLHLAFSRKSQEDF
jgi:Na+:H+ antiporter, NhaA family